MSIPFPEFIIWGLIHLEHYFERIKVLRSERVITQKEIAGLLNMTVNAYQKYEYGEREPEMKVFIALADYFDVSIDYIVGRSDSPEVNR